MAELVEQIRGLPEGKAFADPEMVAELIGRLSELADLCADQETIQKGLDTLSPRETEVRITRPILLLNNKATHFPYPRYK